MGREIIFRGQRIDNGEWVFGYYWQNCGGAFIQSRDGSVYAGIHEVDPDTVGQYFGLKDAIETKLFPGDIIKTKHVRSTGEGFEIEDYEKIGVLEYYHGYHFGPRLRWKKGHMMIPNTSTLWRLKAEVLGSIYENPELLEV